jgi:predicted dehydrogenase
MQGPVRIAVAGTGYGVKVALPVYRELDEFEPVAVWSRRGERAEEVAGEAGLALGTSDFDELLAVPGLEAVHVATPVATHRTFAVAAARKGLHVLCEKPLGANLAEARQIAEAVRSAGVVGMVGYELRLKETRQRLIERAREVLGQPRMVSVSLVQSDHADRESRSYTWVHDAAMGGGRLQAYGVHDLDLLDQCLPPIEAVAAATDVGVPERTGDGGLQPVTAEDAYAVLLRFGAVASVWSAWWRRRGTTAATSSSSTATAARPGWTPADTSGGAGPETTSSLRDLWTAARAPPSSGWHGTSGQRSGKGDLRTPRSTRASACGPSSTPSAGRRRSASGSNRSRRREGWAGAAGGGSTAEGGAEQKALDRIPCRGRGCPGLGCGASRATCRCDLQLLNSAWADTRAGPVRVVDNGTNEKPAMSVDALLALAVALASES